GQLSHTRNHGMDCCRRDRAPGRNGSDHTAGRHQRKTLPRSAVASDRSALGNNPQSRSAWEGAEKRTPDASQRTSSRENIPSENGTRTRTGVLAASRAKNSSKLISDAGLFTEARTRSASNFLSLTRTV